MKASVFDPMMPAPAPPTIAPPLPPGARFAGHEVIALLHRGAHLDVYEAARGGERGALKVVRVAAPWEPAALARFRTEAEGAAALRHPHLVRVRAVGEEAGVPYLFADLLVGETLAAHLAARGPLPLVEAVDLLLPVMSALVLVRRRDVAHGEASAVNVFLTAGAGGAHPWLLDVGLVKAATFEDKRRDARSVGALLRAMLTGAEGTDAPTPEALRADFAASGLSPEAAATLARAFDDGAAATAPSVRQLGRALLPYASAAARSAWADDFRGSLLARGRDALVPRSASRALGLLVAFLLLVAGLWMVRAQLRAGMRTSVTDQRP
jgi:hypothetical protein